MRAAKELSDKVNVELRTQRARERVSANGRLHEIGHAPLPPPTWFQRLFPQEHLIVGGREVKGFVVPHLAAGVLLAAVISSMGFMYSQLSGQRDMLIRLDTQLQERDKHEGEYRREFKDKQELQQVYINDLTKQLVRVQAVLTPAQVKAIQARKLQEN